MKCTNKAFTIVEVIIVIAVIGILAAILILALPRAIDEANEKSALSDAKNTLTEVDIEHEPSDLLHKNYIVIVEKAEKEYVFSVEDGGALKPYESNPFGLCDRAELANSLCDMGLIHAPLGLSEVTLSEQFDNVSVFTGGKTISPERIDVEVNCDMNLPECGILGVAWQVENTALAGIQDGKIHGKAVGKTRLTAISDNMRVAYDLYVGKRVDVTTFAELKAAVEDESESVFIHKNEEVGMISANNVTDVFPITVRSGKYVQLCGPKTSDANEEDDSYCHILYMYDRNHAFSEMFVNDGGILVLNNITLEAVSTKFDNDSDVPAGPISGCLILSRNGGYTELRNGSSLYNSGGTESSSYIFGIPINLSGEDYEVYMERLSASVDNRTDIGLVNEDGEVLIDSSCVYYMKNCENAVMSVSDTNKDKHSIVGCNRLINEGTIYSMSGMYCGIQRYKDDFTGILNTGIIYEIRDSRMSSPRGGTWIDTSGTILSIENCRFEINPPFDTAERIIDFSPTTTTEQAEEYLSRPVTALRIREDGKVGSSFGCNFGYAEIVFEGMSPYKFITSGKFMYEPDGRMICEGSTCRQEDGMYVVEIEN